jgi:hypothetical protein
VSQEYSVVDSGVLLLKHHWVLLAVELLQHAEHSVLRGL